MKIIPWQGEKSRPVSLRRPCPCGCDQRAGDRGVGYLTGSDADGNGFTIWIETEKEFERLTAIIPIAHITLHDDPEPS